MVTKVDRRSSTSILACPSCGGDVEPVSGGLECVACRSLYADDGVLRFVNREAYAESFGLQWKTFSRVQLDSGRLADSERRFRSETALMPNDVRCKLVLEAGCGMAFNNHISAVAYGFAADFIAFYLALEFGNNLFLANFLCADKRELYFFELYIRKFACHFILSHEHNPFTDELSCIID